MTICPFYNILYHVLVCNVSISLIVVTNIKNKSLLNIKTNNMSFNTPCNSHWLLINIWILMSRIPFTRLKWLAITCICHIPFIIGAKLQNHDRWLDMCWEAPLFAYHVITLFECSFTLAMNACGPCEESFISIINFCCPWDVTPSFDHWFFQFCCGSRFEMPMPYLSTVSTLCSFL